MNDKQVALVRSSFVLLRPFAAETANLFYENLFAADPELRHLFNGDMARQEQRLMGMIDNAVALLDRPAALQLILRTLGARHAGYQVRPAHYDAVGAALLATLAQGLGNAYTPDVCGAWSDFYRMVSLTMLQGAREPELEG